MATEQLGSPRHLLQYVTGDALKIKKQEIDMETRAFWKVCKKLANEERIDVLRKVMTAFETDGLPVGQIADAVRIGQPATSTYLAQLQNECGLVACARTGRYCLYRSKDDNPLPRAEELLPGRGDRACFLQRNQTSAAAIFVSSSGPFKRSTRPTTRAHPFRAADKPHEARQTQRHLGIKRAQAHSMHRIMWTGQLRRQRHRMD